MARVYNFSAGPSQMPEPVLRTAAAQMDSISALESGELLL